MMSMLNNLKPHSVTSVDQIKLDPQVFRTVVIENIVLINKALQQSFIIPSFDVFTEQITTIYEKVWSPHQLCRIIINDFSAN